MKNKTIAIFAASALFAGPAYASTYNLTTTEVSVKQPGVSLTAPALYEGLARTAPPDLSEFASRKPNLRNGSLTDELRDSKEARPKDGKPN
ncbi:MAG TPA: hypothetical protein PLZ86_03135 [bacterium]|nr:hypothetical protein [bacterium]